MVVASVAQEYGADVVSRGTIGTRHCAIDKLIRQLQSKSQPRVVVYAAGPCGSGLSRSLTKQGSPCGVVAPSCMPQKTGDRVPTDRRDAMPRARLMRSGDLPSVSVPAVDEAALRDLSRAREATLRDLQAATLRRTAFVRRHAIRSPGRAHWSPAHLRGLRAVGCPTPAQPSVLQADVQTVTAPTARLGRLALARHEHPRQRMPELGRTPAAYASGARRQQGRMTKPGHPHARRVLVAGAWASRSPAHVRRQVPRRLEQRPQAMQAIRWKAQVRLCTRDRQLRAQGQKAHQVVVAMARELVGFLWAMATQVPVPPQASSWR